MFRSSDTRPRPPPPEPPAFAPIQRRRAFEDVCEAIRHQLAIGALVPGDKLPAERDLSLQLGVSRGALREALRSLKSRASWSCARASRAAPSFVPATPPA